MAKVGAEFPPAEAIRALMDAESRLAVKVTPGVRTEALEIVNGRLLAKVRAKPKEGEANEAVVKLLAQGLGVAQSRLTLLRGATAREKLFRVDQP